MRLSVKQPAVVFGRPRVSLNVLPTGDPQIDDGLEAFLLRQPGVDKVGTQHAVGQDEVIYDVALAIKPRIGVVMMDLVAAIETYYDSWGMTPQISVASDR